MSKVKCYVCKKFGHYAGQCPNKKKKKGGTAATIEEIDFQTQFQRECAFLICCASVELALSIWYIDSGASSHMTGLRENFLISETPRSGLRFLLEMTEWSKLQRLAQLPFREMACHLYRSRMFFMSLG
jgi:hypothetical protein